MEEKGHGRLRKGTCTSKELHGLVSLVARDGGSCFGEALIFSAKQETGHVLKKGGDGSWRFEKHEGGWDHPVTWQSEVGRKQTSRQCGSPVSFGACVRRVPPELGRRLFLPPQCCLGEGGEVGSFGAQSGPGRSGTRRR